MSGLPPHELYAAQLLHLRLGYALFEPNPNGAYDRVRVGDVGYISRDGKYIRLFNAFHDANDEVNQGGHFPDGFEPIEGKFRGTDRLESLQPGSRLAQSVRKIGGDLGISGMLEVVGGARVQLSCETLRGAALMTKKLATRQYAFSPNAMEDYMLANFQSWLRLIRDLRRPVELHDLIFVDECTLTADWATIVWDRSSRDSQISFTAGINGAANLSLSYWGQWEDHVVTPKRVGPCRSSGVHETSPDQCIFVKGIRFALRSWYEKITSKLKGKASARSDAVDDLQPRQSALQLLADFGLKLELVGTDGSSFRPIQNAYQMLALFIFHKSDADVAIVEDNDLEPFQLAKAGSLEEIFEAIFNYQGLSNAVSVTENGDVKVARIRWNEPEPFATPSEELVLLNEAYEKVHIKSEWDEPSLGESTRPSDWDVESLITRVSAWDLGESRRASDQTQIKDDYQLLKVSPTSPRTHSADCDGASSKSAKIRNSGPLGLSAFELAKAVQDIKVHRMQCRDLSDRCTKLLLAFRERCKGLEVFKLMAAENEVFNIIEGALRKARMWASWNCIKSIVNQRDIMLGLEEIYRDIDLCAQQFNIVSTAELHQSRLELAIIQERDIADNREILRGILQSPDSLRDDLSDPNAVRPIMQNCQERLQEEYMIDLTGQIQRTSKKPCARGAYNDVYTGLWLGEEKVALKFARAINLTEKARNRFRKEVEILRDLHHPHVCRLYGIYLEEGEIYSVSPWMECGSALDFINSTDKIIDRLDILRDVASGMEYLHDRDVVHGDLRAANILVGKDGSVSVSDFGLSRVIAEEVAPELLSARTRHGDSAVRWKAPELIQQDYCEGTVSFSPATDVWSFGMLCLEILTGKRPYDNRAGGAAVVNDLVQRRLPTRPTDAAVVNRGLNAGMWNVMVHCWSWEPTERPSMATLKTRIRYLEALHLSRVNSPERSNVNADNGNFLIPISNPRLRSKSETSVRPMWQWQMDVGMNAGYNTQNQNQSHDQAPPLQMNNGSYGHQLPRLNTPHMPASFGPPVSGFDGSNANANTSNNFLNPNLALGPLDLHRVRRERQRGHRRNALSADMTPIYADRCGTAGSFYQPSDFTGRSSGSFLSPGQTVGLSGVIISGGGLGMMGASGAHRRSISHSGSGYNHSRSLSRDRVSLSTSPNPSPHASPRLNVNELPDMYPYPSASSGYGLDGGAPTVHVMSHDEQGRQRRGRTEANFTCPVPGCGSTFARHFNLIKGHMRSHKFKCKRPGCDKEFARQHDCKQHEQLHLNIRPCSCQGCQRTFASMKALNRHYTDCQRTSDRRPWDSYMGQDSDSD